LHDVIKVIRKIKPDLVLTHSHDDKHRDHKCLSLVTCEGVWKAWENILPSLGERHRVREIWAFEVVDPFSYPDIIVDITNYLQYKIDAMEVHNSQHDVLGGSNEICNYITGLAMVRGYLNGCKYGEAFKICNILPRSI